MRPGLGRRGGPALADGVRPAPGRRDLGRGGGRGRAGRGPAGPAAADGGRGPGRRRGHGPRDGGGLHGVRRRGQRVRAAARAAARARDGRAGLGALDAGGLGRGLQGAPRGDGRLAVQDRPRRRARRGWAGRVRRARPRAPAGDAHHRAARRPAARRRRPGGPAGAGAPGRGAHGAAPRVPGRGRGRLQRLGGGPGPLGHRRTPAGQRLPPGAGRPHRLLAGPPALRRVHGQRGHVPRAARLPALRAQRPGRLGHHARLGGRAGPVRRAVPGGRGHPRGPYAAGLGASAVAPRDHPRPGRARRRGPLVGDVERPGGARRPRRRDRRCRCAGRPPTGRAGSSGCCPPCCVPPRPRTCWRPRSRGWTPSTTWWWPTSMVTSATCCAGSCPCAAAPPGPSCRCRPGTRRTAGPAGSRSRTCHGPSTRPSSSS